MLAVIKPLPDFVKTITNANIGYGEKAGSFQVWPIAHPAISVERGKSATISLRLRPVDGSNATLKLPADAPAMFKLRREAGGTYWLDISVEPAKDAGARAFPLAIESSDGNNVAVKLTVNIPAENLLVTPAQVDMGEVALSNARAGIARSGRVGIKKLVGSLRIKSLSATLAFLTLEQQAIVDGSNYLIRIRVNPDAQTKAGAYSGTVKIETDDGNTIEIPIKLTLVDR